MPNRKRPELEQRSSNHITVAPMKPNAALKVTRRAMLTASGLTALMVGSHPISPAIANQKEDEEIQQPSQPVAADFMARAFEMRRIAVERGDQSYGAVIVQGSQIIGQSWSRVVIDQDPTGHAEMAAIRDATRRLDSRDLTGTVMYSSSRPCPMCEAAAYWAGVDELVYGRELDTAGPPRLCG